MLEGQRIKIISSRHSQVPYGTIGTLIGRSRYLKFDYEVRVKKRDKFERFFFYKDELMVDHSNDFVPNVPVPDLIPATVDLQKQSEESIEMEQGLNKFSPLQELKNRLIEKSKSDSDQSPSNESKF